jgi:hypothetical protein
MPGTRDGNLRSGHLAEDLGVLLLRRIAAVAQVRHQDDVGIDAICTMLVADAGNKRRLMAKETCCVQLKSASERKVTYRVDQLRWLGALELPFFFGSIDQETGTISIYTLNGAVQQAHLGPFVSPAEPMTFHLENHPGPPGPSNPFGNTYLGPPALQWSIRSTDAELDEVVAVFRAWCAALQVNIRLQSMDACEFLRWQTNKPPISGGAMHSSAQTLHALAAIRVPAKAIALDFIQRKAAAAWKMWRPVIALIDANADHLDALPSTTPQLAPESLVLHFDHLAKGYHKDGGRWMEGGGEHVAGADPGGETATATGPETVSAARPERNAR